MPPKKVIFKRKTPVKKTAEDRIQNRKIAQLRRQLMPELKHYNFAYEPDDKNIAYSNDMRVLAMCNPAQGTTQVSRIGDSIMLKGFWLRMSGIASATNNWVRLIVVHDRRMFTTTLAGADLLLNYSVVSTSDYNAHSTYQPDVVNDRFGKGKSVDILLDKTIYFGQNTLSNQTRKNFHIVKHYKVGKKINFSGGGTATGQVYMYIFPGNSVVAANNPAISISGTSYYSDV